MSGDAGRCTGTKPDSWTFRAREPASVESSGMSRPKNEYASGASAAKRSSWRHMTALGMPVVPPV